MEIDERKLKSVLADANFMVGQSVVEFCVYEALCYEYV